MSKAGLHLAAIALAAALGFAAAPIGLGPLAAPTAAAQAQNPLAEFEGTWRVNLAKSVMGRAGPAGDPNVRADSFTWVYKADGPTKLTWLIYHEYPLPKPSKTMTIIPDGQWRPCEMNETCLSRPGDPKEQSYAFWQMDRRLFVRIFRVKGVPVEYNIYAVSEDGKTFVTTVWSPQTPQFQTRMVFDKQQESVP